MFYEYLKFNWTRLMNLPYLRLCKIRSTDFVIIPRLGKVTLRKWRKRTNRQVQSALLFSKCKKYFPFFKNCQLPYIFSLTQVRYCRWSWYGIILQVPVSSALVIKLHFLLSSTKLLTLDLKVQYQKLSHKVCILSLNKYLYI